MKAKIAFYLIVALCGVLTAFATVKKTNNYVAQTCSACPTCYILVNLADRGVAWDCIPNQTTYCLYFLKANAVPDENGCYHEDDIEGPDISTYNEKFVWLF